MGNDVSERHWQSGRGPAWDKGKGFESFGPLAPGMVTKDEVADPQKLRMWTDVDGRGEQDGSTKTMIFGVRTLVSCVSPRITLFPGDVIRAARSADPYRTPGWWAAAC